MYERFFGERLAGLRTKKGVSARVMSQLLGKSDGYISFIENGKSYPSMELFFRICEYLEITPREFFDEQNQNPEMVNTITRELQELNESKWQSILDVIRNMKK